MLPSPSTIVVPSLKATDLRGLRSVGSSYKIASLSDIVDSSKQSLLFKKGIKKVYGMLAAPFHDFVLSQASFERSPTKPHQTLFIDVEMTYGVRHAGLNSTRKIRRQKNTRWISSFRIDFERGNVL